MQGGGVSQRALCMCCCSLNAVRTHLIRRDSGHENMSAARMLGHAAEACVHTHCLHIHTPPPLSRPAAPGSDEPPPQEHRSSQGGRSGAAGLPLPSGGGGGPQGGRGGRGRGRGRAVPDYVKHPEKYTVYVLDEPLVVGGGLSHGAEQQQVCCVWVGGGGGQLQAANM